MSNENNQLPEPVAPPPPDADAGPVGAVVTVPESPGTERAAASLSPPPGVILLAVFLAVLAIAAVLYFSRSRAPAPVSAEPAAPVTITLPATETPLAGGAHDAPGPANPSPAKIFNDTASAKETIGAADPAATPQEGAITELPSAPHAAPDGFSNDALRDAAKNALRNKAGDVPQAEKIEPEASLAPYDARALAELEAEGRRAIAFSALALKARSGAPYTDELRAYLAVRQDQPLPGLIADLAGKGAPTAAALARSFGDYQRAALAAGRRAEAAGPVAGLGASLATLIHLRPARPSAGTTTAAILSRAEAAVAAEDLGAALHELAGLRLEAAAPLAVWIGDARARLALEAALGEREQALFAALQDGRLR